MQAQGTQEEEAALTLGASGWRTFFSVTLPNVRWGLLYGVLLLQRARDGRVRRGVGGVGPHPRADQHHAAACRDSLQRIQFRRRLRGGVAARAAGPGHAGAEDFFEWRFADAIALGDDEISEGAIMSVTVTVENIEKEFGALSRPARRLAEGAWRRADGDPRTFRLRQDHAAARDRGPGAAGSRPRDVRRSRCGDFCRCASAASVSCSSITPCSGT